MADRDEQQERRGPFETVESKLLAVRMALKHLRSSEGFLLKTASSSDTDVVMAAASTGAPEGQTTVRVEQLASASRLVAATALPATSGTVASGTGTLQFKVGLEDTQTIELTPSTTLSELVRAINALNAGATASAVQVGSPGSPLYELRVIADTIGSPGNIVVENDDTDLGLSATAATNARFTLAECSGSLAGCFGASTRFSGTLADLSEMIEQTSNTVNDVIPGVTLVLRQSESSARVMVTKDTSAIQNRVQALVSALNALVAFSEQSMKTRYAGATKSDLGGHAGGEKTVREVLERFRGGIGTETGKPANETTKRVTALSQIGISTLRNRRLAFDAEAFQRELAANPERVGEFFGGGATADGFANVLHHTIAEIFRAGGFFDDLQDDQSDQIPDSDVEIGSEETAIRAFRPNLVATCAALESSVNAIRAQGDFLMAQLYLAGNIDPDNAS